MKDSSIAVCQRGGPPPRSRSRAPLCYPVVMKTPVDLPEELVHALANRAAREDRAPEDLLADLVRRGLGPERPRAAGKPARVQFPLVHGTRPATPETEMTPERVAEILIAEEAAQAIGQ